MAEVWRRSAFTAYADIFPADAPEPTLESMIEQLEPADSLVAVDDTRIVGLVHPHDGWLTHLYVDPTHWGRGIGARLHDAALDQLRA
ncbi:MAG TPA: GNAT family N-acetyltransferase, partial [Acidimicrobiales bacterium]|nr:GNAT family N-acetyltransferase [Acidimicrobiales bacterium]